MFARTERLLLRPGWIEDAPLLAATIGNPAIVRNLATAPWPYGEPEAMQFLTQYMAQSHAEKLPNFLIFLRTRAEPQLIGGCGLATTAEGDVEMGYWIAPSHWGLGFATEAGRALVRIARDGLRLNHLHAGHFTDNPASGRVLRKLGFAPTGRIVERQSMARGGAVACVDYALDLTAAAQTDDGGKGGISTGDGPVAMHTSQSLPAPVTLRDQMAA